MSTQPGMMEDELGQTWVRPPTQDEWRRIVATALVDDGYIDLDDHDGIEYLAGERGGARTGHLEETAYSIAAAFTKMMGEAS